MSEDGKKEYVELINMKMLAETSTHRFSDLHCGVRLVFHIQHKCYCRSHQLFSTAISKLSIVECEALKRVAKLQ